MPLLINMAKRKLISQSTAARLKGCSRQNIHELIKRGRLKTYTLEGNSTRLVDENEVLNLGEAKRGRPLKRPRFKKGTRVRVINRKLSDALGTITRPMGDRVYLEMDNGDKMSVHVSEIRVATNASSE